MRHQLPRAKHLAVCSAALAGLGLAIALEAIRQHRGTIIASNANPIGLEVKILLPTCYL